MNVENQVLCPIISLVGPKILYFINLWPIIPG